MFKGKKPKVIHFCLYGFVNFSHVPFDNMKNIEPTTERGIFVGYDETSKAFRIYLPALRKVVMRREVRFEEEWVFRKSRESVQGEHQVPTPQVASQVPSVQSIGSQVFRVTGPQVIGIGSLVSVVHPTSISGTCYGS